MGVFGDPGRMRQLWKCGPAIPALSRKKLEDQLKASLGYIIPCFKQNTQSRLAANAGCSVTRMETGNFAQFPGAFISRTPTL